MAPSRGKMGVSRGKMGLLSRMGLPSRKTDILGWASPQVEKNPSITNKAFKLGSVQSSQAHNTQAGVDWGRTFVSVHVSYYIKRVDAVLGR